MSDELKYIQLAEEYDKLIFSQFKGRKLTTEEFVYLCELEAALEPLCHKEIPEELKLVIEQVLGIRKNW